MSSLQAFFVMMAGFVGFCSGLAIKGRASLGAFVVAVLKALGCAVGGAVIWMAVMMLGNILLSGSPERLSAEAPGAALFVLYTGLVAAAVGFAPAALGAGVGLGLRQALNRLPRPERPPAFTPTIVHDRDSDETKPDLA